MNEQTTLLTGQVLMAQKDALVSVPDASSESVAERIVQLRKERKLTLQECARLTGVAASTLSKIERRELSPTISTLQKIAEGLTVELTELITQTRPVYAPGRRAVSRAGEGKKHTSLSCANLLLCGDLKDKRMIPVRTRVTARSLDDYPVWARSDTEIFLWVVSGRMLLHSKVYEPLEMGPGDSVYYDGNGEHCWTSIGDEDAEVIWVMSA
ncbi:helix-turn-helix transcriptional regulator [Ciceribacter sp. L1K23]|uniref:helix-turn-helix domain-containing protein n=1 Tax=Ciceribacter sp. L1K23 TaxID=2820276 RepID=UPI001B811DA6|nr:XRE family transcriptional regulator [Ciceribacter sp. L1K23]MBR0554428.1 helix-turn-helix transcriptional regulator [Ciceribacter sp. L1K23]